MPHSSWDFVCEDNAMIFTYFQLPTVRVGCLSHPRKHMCLRVRWKDSGFHGTELSAPLVSTSPQLPQRPFSVSSHCESSLTLSCSGEQFLLVRSSCSTQHSRCPSRGPPVIHMWWFQSMAIRPNTNPYLRDQRSKLNYPETSGFL